MIALTLVCLALCALLAYREWANARERRDLYQRIQAPQLAVASHEQNGHERKPVPVVSLEDDARLKEIREGRERGDR